MKKPVQSILFTFVVLIVLLSGCAPASTIPPTFTPEPTSTPFVMPTGDLEISWDTYNSDTVGEFLSVV